MTDDILTHSSDKQGILTGSCLPMDQEPEILSLRPEQFADYVGQAEVVEALKIAIEAAIQRKEPVDHILFHGPPGLGKTTLAHIIANEMGGNLTSTSGPSLEKGGDLIGILTHLEDKDILFIDEIHRTPKIVEEFLYPAMEDFAVDFIFDKGMHARSHKYRLNRFTLVGATTRVVAPTSVKRFKRYLWLRACIPLSKIKSTAKSSMAGYKNSSTILGVL